MTPKMPPVMAAMLTILAFSVALEAEEELFMSVDVELESAAE